MAGPPWSVTPPQLAPRLPARAGVDVAGDIPDGSTITLDADGDELVVRWAVPGAETRSGEREEVTA